jgi:hypothetical protein
MTEDEFAYFCEMEAARPGAGIRQAYVHGAVAFAVTDSDHVEVALAGIAVCRDLTDEGVASANPDEMASRIVAKLRAARGLEDGLRK